MYFSLFVFHAPGTRKSVIVTATASCEAWLPLLAAAEFINILMEKQAEQRRACFINIFIYFAKKKTASLIL